MSIDYDGGMIIGNFLESFESPEDYEGDFYDWAEEQGLESMSLYYDAGNDQRVWGFPIDDVDVADIDAVWLTSVKKLASRFEVLTGEKARLIGTQNIT